MTGFRESATCEGTSRNLAPTPLPRPAMVSSVPKPGGRSVGCPAPGRVLFYGLIRCLLRPSARPLSPSPHTHTIHFKLSVAHADLEPLLSFG